MNTETRKGRSSRKPIIVVGAGLSGLIAAGQLENLGFACVVIEKARGVGGRMATRRVGTAAADHGAQFFTARDASFKGLVKEWISQGVAQEWSKGFVDPDGNVKQDGHPRYRGTDGMTGVPKWLARSLNVRLDSRVTGIRTTSEQSCLVELDSGDVIPSPAVVLTPPLPQALLLLEAGGVDLPRPIATALGGIAYDPCVALIALLDKPSRIPRPGAVQFEDGPIAWVADNRMKGVSPDQTAVTIHANPELSRSLWGLEDMEVAKRMLAQCERWLGSNPSDVQIHRWRYSKPSSLYPQKTLLLSQPAPLAFAGDAFAGPRVEGAALSGLAAAEALARLLQGLTEA